MRDRGVACRQRPREERVRIRIPNPESPSEQELCGWMQSKPSPLLCELHAHSTWSDGALGLRDLCDLYGRRGFDVLAITDHATARARARARRQLRRLPACGSRRGAAGARALRPSRDPRPRAHVRRPGSSPRGPRRRDRAAVVRRRLGRARFRARASARGRGGARRRPPVFAERARRRDARGTAAFGARPELAELVDRFELFNRHTLFSWVATAGHPTVATGDFHRLEHLATWKTLLPCAKDEPSVIAYLRSARPAYLVRLEAELRAAA